jgi:outer membrane protein assembly factor BamA
MIFLFAIFCLFTSLFAQDEPRFQVAEIVLIGNQVTKPWVIERELHFDVEDSVSASDLDAARLRLLSLELFNNVHVDYDEEGVVTVQVSEQFRFIPVTGASAVEGSFGDALKDPGRIMDIVVFTAGVADINHRGNGGMVGVLTEFGARTGFSVQYKTRWLSPRKPIALHFGLYSMRISDRHASVQNISRRLENRGAFFDVATRRGAPSRLGLVLRYDHIQDPVDAFSPGARYDVAWISPYVILDRRNLEWYPTNGFFARGDIDFASGKSAFVRSRAALSIYRPLTRGKRPLLIAARGIGGTLQDNTPTWGRYFFGFYDKLRGYASVQTEAANYLAGEIEMRFPISPEYVFDVPFVGRYGDDIPFWVGGGLFFQRAQTQLAGLRDDVYAYGAALHFRFPYVQILEASVARNRDDDIDVVFETGIRF